MAAAAAAARPGAVAVGARSERFQAKVCRTARRCAGVQTIALRLGRLRDRLPFSVGDRKAYRVLADNTDAKPVEQ